MNVPFDVMREAVLQGAFIPLPCKFCVTEVVGSKFRWCGCCRRPICKSCGEFLGRQT